MEDVQTRVLDDASQYSDYSRGDAFLEALKAIGISVSGMRIADLGTGYGSIALAAARSGAMSVIAVDANKERIEEVARRASAAGVTLDCRVSNLLLPLTELPAVDLAFMVGVVEYAGLWDLTAPVSVLQRRVLENACSVLKPGGTFVLATKNRLWPMSIFKDINTGQPLVNALPRVAADWLSRVTRGRSYREHIHTPKHWRAIVKDAGFRDVEIFYPYFSYQFPLCLVKRPRLSDLQKIDVERLPLSLRRLAGTRMATLKIIIAASTFRIGMPVTQSIILKAVK